EYLGIGSNEPYNMEHPQEAHVQLSGRPRYYIYDRARNAVLEHRVTFDDLGPFDWDWTVRPLHMAGANEAHVYFVSLGGDLVCISNAEEATASEPLSAQKLV